MRTLIKSTISPFAGIMVFMLCICLSIHVKAADRLYYQIKVYHLKNAQQVDRVEQYLKDAYLPAMHKLGIKNIGVFKPITDADTSDRKLYVFIPFKNMDELEATPAKLLKDDQYLANGKDYLDAVRPNEPYVRIETILLRAFAVAPGVTPPNLTSNKTERYYELRSYESATEKYATSKLKMFEGEIAIFNKVNSNGVFYAQVIAGARMPNLMYMTVYNDKKDMDDHWTAFFATDEWKVLNAVPEYKGNVTKAERNFLHATPYSDF
ncbi:MAG: NIPSNAP family protein [Mucilaginibacter sp.]